MVCLSLMNLISITFSFSSVVKVVLKN